ncbi:MAG: ferritin-like domain-containing protein [Thioalkalivibrionaceae bacterium]
MRGTKKPTLDDVLERALLTRDPALKCERVETLFEDWWSGALQRSPQDQGPPIRELPRPGRPFHPRLVSPRHLSPRGLGTHAGRVALLHAVAHIEFNAIQLALDAAYRFRDLPLAFVSDWLRVATEETRHFRMLRARLLSLGADYGDYPAHDGLWAMCFATRHDPLERMALVPRLLEARGLDVTPGMIKRLEAVGDDESAAILRLIHHEEVAHVAIGSEWFRYLALSRGLDPDATFIALLRRHAASRVTPPFDWEARARAGFNAVERAGLEALANAAHRELKAEGR